MSTNLICTSVRPADTQAKSSHRRHQRFPCQTRLVGSRDISTLTHSHAGARKCHHSNYGHHKTNASRGHRTQIDTVSVILIVAFGYFYMVSTIKLEVGLTAPTLRLAVALAPPVMHIDVAHIKVQYKTDTMMIMMKLGAARA